MKEGTQIDHANSSPENNGEKELSDQIIESGNETMRPNQ